MLVSNTVVPGDQLPSYVRISTTTAETNLTNNNASVMTIVGSFADMTTNVSCPAFARIGETINITASYANMGNTPALDNQLLLSYQ